jgi:hypothetical protein
MEKKLPNLYVNKIEKHINNNNAMFYSAHKKEVDQESINTKKVEIIVKSGDVKDEIKKMFDSPNYVYKMDATIVLKNNETIKKGIIGQTSSKLLTIDDDLIDINDIKEIHF